MSTHSQRARPTTKGFARASKLVQGRVRDASASRGFAQSQLLTQWEEVVGPDVAAIARPVEVSYARGGFGATLVLLTTGAQAPMLEMQKEQIRSRVNAVYGYNAIARVRITQTAPRGFSEGKVAFQHASARQVPAQPSEAARAAASQVVAPVADDGLRAALETLGAHVTSKSKGSETG